MGWNRDQLRKEYQDDKTLLKLSRDQLIASVIELQVALYPFVSVLASLDDKLDWPHGSMHLSSDLFPLEDDKGKWSVYNPSKSSSDKIDPLPPERLHEVEYYTQDSINLGQNEGGKFHDNVEILGGHQYATASYICCGNITMADVRFADNVLRKDKETKDGTKLETLLANALEGLLPKHDASLMLMHNEHKTVYENVETWVKNNPKYVDWISEEQKQKAIDTNEAWVLHWYPNTPVGFNCVGAADLESMFTYLQGSKDGKH